MMDASLIPFIFVSSVLRLTAAGDSIICAWTKVLPGREVHYSYIRTSSRTASPSLILYHTSWSGTRALPGCTWSDDIAVINDYLDLCKRPDFTFYGRLHINPDDKSLSRAEDRCVPLTSAGRRSVRSVNGHDGEDGRSEGRIHQRVKRSFIVPGTLWCGSGNKAPSYQDLGRLVLLLKQIAYINLLVCDFICCDSHVLDSSEEKGHSLPQWFTRHVQSQQRPVIRSQHIAPFEPTTN